MKALRAELAVELVGGVVSVGTSGRSVRIWSTDGDGAAGTFSDPTLGESVVNRQVPEGNAYADLFVRPFPVWNDRAGS